MIEELATTESLMQMIFWFFGILVGVLIGYAIRRDTERQEKKP